MPAIYNYVYGKDIGINYVINSIIFAIPISIFIVNIPYKIGQLLFVFFISICNIANITLLAAHGSFINISEIRAVIGANPIETSGLGAYIIANFKWHILLEVVFLIGLSIQITWTPIIYKRHLLVGALITGSVIFLILEFTSFSTIRYEPYQFSKQLLDLLEERLTRICMLSSDNLSYGAKQKDGNAEGTFCVLAIGESLNYEHFSLHNKYHRNTTPNLAKEDNIILYQDYFSTALFTAKSVPMILNMQSPTNYNEHYYYQGIGGAFQEIGYKSYLVSHTDQLMHTDAYQYLTTSFDSIIWVSADADMPNQLGAIARTENNVFVVLHFLGNHMMYGNYPPEFEIFTPSYTTSPKSNQDSLLVNAYNNSILYTDFILSECIKCIKNAKKKGSLIFVSDHGEYIDAKTAYHGFRDTISPSEYHVPLMVWYSDEYAAAYPNKVANMIKHKDEPVCGDHVFWSVLDMAGIEIDSTMQEEGMSIFGDSLRPHQRTLLLPDGKTIMELL
jgi:glucan phosphoethanolaminetransferase (alkaline phosphatase superfamily)